MFKKLILSAAAAITLMVGMQAPASAAMAIAKPAATQTEAASDIVEVRGRRHRGGFRRSGGFRRHRGFRRHGGFRHHRWKRHHYWGSRHYYRDCFWRHGRKYCS